MFNSDKKAPTTADLERAERIRDVLENLKEANKVYPVIVEGKRDASALKMLGLEGEIITIHRGKGLYELCEELLDRFTRMILLLDWDEKGEMLYRTVSQHLGGHWEEFSSFRNVLKMLCQKDIRDIEGIPKLLLRLEGSEYPR